MQHDAFDQAAQDRHRFMLGGLVGEGLAQLKHRLPVARTHGGMQQQLFLFRLSLKPLLDLGALGFQHDHPILHALGGHAVADGIDHPVKFTDDLGKPRFILRAVAALGHAQRIQVPRIFFAEHSEQLFIHQVMLKAVQYRGFKNIAADRALVLAGAFVACARTPEMLLADLDECAAAAAAFDQAGEQEARAAAIPKTFGIGLVMFAERRGALPRLHLLPKIILDDPQMRDVVHDPLIGRIEARQAFARLGVFDIAQAVPYKPPDIELVVQDSRAAIFVAVDRGRPPGLACRPCYAFGIQRLGDYARRSTCGVFIEDAAHDVRLIVVDFTITALGLARCIDLSHHIIAVGVAAAGLARLDTAAQAAAGLVGQVLEEERVHRAFEANMQLADHSFAERDDLHASKVQALEHACDIFLVAGNPVQRLGDHHLKLARHGILQELLDAGAHQTGPRDTVISIMLRYVHALARRALGAQPELILD